MSIHAPPRYVVQSVDTPRAGRRRRLYIGLCWLASLVLVALVVYLATDRGPLASPNHAAMRDLKAQDAKLRQQVATLTRAQQVSQVATNSLKDTLADREEKLNGLRADLAFYGHLIGGGAQQHGLRVQDVHLSRVGTSRAWNVTVTLTHNVKLGTDIRGTLRVSVEGIVKSHLTRLAWKQLSDAAASKGLDFSFRYFQQVHGTLMLPPGFTPNRLRVEADPSDGQPVVLSLDWSEALKPAEDFHVQQ